MGIESLHHRLSEIVGELVARGLPLRQARRQFERLYLVSALRQHGGSLIRAAEHLGVHRNTLRNRLDELGIRASEYRPTLRRGARTGKRTPTAP
jgi:DNA-binding NtrC family response regulator